MTHITIIEIAALLIAALLLMKPLGSYMACVYERKPCKMERLFGPVEKWCYRLAGINPGCEMTWKQYLLALLIFNFLGMIFLFVVLCMQGSLPLNPEHFKSLNGDLAINTAVSFVTNTNWKAYAGETTLSYFSDMLGITVQNFLSAATGLTVVVVLIRGFIRRETNLIGNFWVDLVRSVLYVLLPLAVIVALILMSQGVIQNLKPYVITHVLNAGHYGMATQTLPMGPVASQIAITTLGSNGGGFFNVGLAHPFANPTPFSNFIEMLAMVLIPVALTYTFGKMVRDTRQGFAIILAMLIVFVPMTLLLNYSEQLGNPVMQSLDVDSNVVPDLMPGGNMQGKELRFGITGSSLSAATATATSAGAPNLSLDALTPISGLVSMFLMQTGEVIFGGVGSGLYGMLILVMITVFLAGLMVGRTPEYLGKKIEVFEIKMAAVVILLMPILVLLGSAAAVLTQSAVQAMGNPGAHGFSEILYAFTSLANNNGSGFQGLNANIPFINIVGALIMLVGRFGVMIPILAIAGSLAAKKNTPVSPGTLPTYSGLFIALLVVVIVMIAGLTFIPALALGPIVEQLQMYHL